MNNSFDNAMPTYCHINNYSDVLKSTECLRNKSLGGSLTMECHEIRAIRFTCQQVLHVFSTGTYSYDCSNKMKCNKQQQLQQQQQQQQQQQKYQQSTEWKTISSETIIFHISTLTE